ncbi:hypothetical protein [Microbacterium sp. G2-8]|uniref:hypothetical protein n=1 Tax=Microbacterium sp. G2-8 TaxID=2842454 RepID=UPI001C891637|nr:hypothetical protein [Microbacterium sp. G2-8]
MGAKRRPSKAVYRRRRLVVGVFALLVLAGIITGAAFGVRWIVAEQPWQNLPFFGESAPAAEEVEDPIPTLQPTDNPGDGSDGSSSSPSEKPEPEACANGALKVVAVTDQDEYDPGETPRISLELTNAGDVDCVVNVGTTQQRFEIASGADTWWRSSDCQTEPSDHWVTIAAGQTVSTQQSDDRAFTWDRTRSSVSTCDAAERPSAIGGGATYSLTVQLGEVVSQPTTFLLY